MNRSSSVTLPYREGSIFVVPLRGNGYARGVVARSGKEGKILLGYFFGPRLSARSPVPLEDVNPNGSILRALFGDLSLISGEWPVSGQVPNWDKAQWPMPDFVRKEPFSKRAWLVRHSDVDPGKIESETPTDFSSLLPNDSLYGSGAVEIALTKLLAG